MNAVAIAFIMVFAMATGAIMMAIKGRGTDLDRAERKVLRARNELYKAQAELTTQRNIATNEERR